MPARRLHLSPMLAALTYCAAALLWASSAGAAPPTHSASPAAAPLYVEDPAGPIKLDGPPNSLVSRNREGFTSGEGWGSVLVGLDSRKGSEIVWNTPKGLFYLSGYHRPRGPGVVTGDTGRFGVIDAPARLVRIFERSDGRYRKVRTVPTGEDPVAVIEGWAEMAIVNRGSADLWYYPTGRGDEKTRTPTAKVPLGGDLTDAVGTNPAFSGIFIADASTDRVVQIVLEREGAPTSRRSIPVGRDPVDLDLGQLLPDREPEIAVADRRSDTVTILGSPPNTVGMVVPIFSRIATYAAGDEPVAVRWVNADMEKGADLAVLDAGSDRLTILLNDGKGHLHRAASYKTGPDPVAVSAIDFDRSFGPDLAVANHGSKTLTIFLRHYSAVCRGREARPITGTEGDDDLYGERGIDMMRGLAGDDRILGNGDGDCLYGGPGADFLLGRSGGDLIDGGPGDDRLFGGMAAWSNQRDHNTIIGGPGRDVIRAGWASDVIRAGDGEKDIVDCGGGIDTAYVDPVDLVRHCERVHVLDHHE